MKVFLRNDRNFLVHRVDEPEPGRRPRRAAAARIPGEIRERAVAGLVAGDSAAKAVADELGVERATPCNWRRRLLSEEVSRRLPRKTDARTIDELEEYVAELRSDIDRLELGRAIPEGDGRASGKRPERRPANAANREKATLAEGPRPAHEPDALLDAVGMPRGGCPYQKRALARPGRYSGLRIRVTEISLENDGLYGHRGIRAALRSEGATVSEKVFCRIMKEGRLAAKRSAKRKYSSHKGEIDEAPGNIVKRGLHAEARTCPGSPISPSSQSRQGEST